jgi:hypothetical protein
MSLAMKTEVNKFVRQTFVFFFIGRIKISSMKSTRFMYYRTIAVDGLQEISKCRVIITKLFKTRLETRERLPSILIFQLQSLLLSVR